ncbi:MAG: hypothetical protein ACRDRU_02665 [Pseudonocardiaceae bacterium]
MATKTYPEEVALPVYPDTLTEDASPGVLRHKDSVVHRMLVVVDAGEAAIHRWLMRYSLTALRISLGAVLLGFGILKYFPGVSPAEGLVLALFHVVTFGLVPAVVPNIVVMVLAGTLECIIGLLLLTGRWLRLTIVLLAVQMGGILAPAVLLPGRLFAGPHHMPILEGQYVLKDVILLAAAMVIATTVRGGRLTDSGSSSAQTK